MPNEASVAVVALLIPKGPGSAELMNCVRIDGQDAQPAVLKALQANGQRVAPASECEFTEHGETSVHRATGAKASFIALENFSRFGETAAEVDGSSFSGRLSGFTVRFDLEYKGGRWHVVSQQPTGVA